MSIDYTLYFGPYIKCYVKFENQDPWDCDERLTDFTTFTETDCDILLVPNHEPFGQMINCNTETIEKVVTPDDITQELKYFEEDYAAEIAQLKEIYAEVEVSWGIFNSIS